MNRFNREELKQIMPHREPMLLVDDATVVAEGLSEGHYTVRGDEYFLQGHFPGNPMVPGVILCEMAAQSSVVLFADVVAGKTPVFTGIKEVKFRHSVRPGDTVTFRCRMTRQRLPFCFLAAEAYVGDTLCMSGEFSFAITAGATSSSAT